MKLDIIYNEDCLTGMQRLPDRSVDAIICDLPYGTTANPWDSVLPLDQLWAHYKRIVKPQGAIVLFAQCPFDKVLGASNLPMLKYEWIWRKPHLTGFLNAHHQPMRCHETILVFSHGSASPSKRNPMVYNPQMRQGKPYVKVRTDNCHTDNYRAFTIQNTISDGKFHPISVLDFSRDPDSWHPTQKPVDLLRYLVLTYTPMGGVILDNCMGSGSLAIACIREHRHYVGFELNPDYYARALRRIDAELAQPRLF